MIPLSVSLYTLLQRSPEILTYCVRKLCCIDINKLRPSPVERQVEDKEVVKTCDTLETSNRGLQAYIEGVNLGDEE